MPKKQKKQKRIRLNTYGDEVHEDRVMRELQNMKHKDLQKACILRGMTSEEVVAKNHHDLVGWFHKNYENSQDPQRLVLHDAWVESQMVARGYTKGKEFLHPALRFGIPGDLEKVEKVKEVKPEKAQKIPSAGKTTPTKNEKFNIRTGTKKELTFLLTEEKIEIKEIIKQVKDAFPEAQEKSIKIWHKRALKAMKTK